MHGSQLSVMAASIGLEGPTLEENVVVAATFKVLVLGNNNVGKSSLIKCYSTAEKPRSMMPTIGRYPCLEAPCINFMCAKLRIVIILYLPLRCA